LDLSHYTDAAENLVAPWVDEGFLCIDQASSLEFCDERVVYRESLEFAIAQSIRAAVAYVGDPHPPSAECSRDTAVVPMPRRPSSSLLA